MQLDSKQLDSKQLNSQLFSQQLTSKEDYKWLLSTNPFLRARVDFLDATQSELADMMGVTVQYIYRHEKGLVNTPSDDLIRLLVSGNSIGRYENEVAEFRHKYYTWVSAMRLMVYRAIRDTDVNVKNMKKLIRDVNFAMKMTYGVNGEIRSQQMFNRVMCLHPRTLQLYFENNSIKNNSVLSNALADIGIAYHEQELL